jgi:protein kinase-like protein
MPKDRWEGKKFRGWTVYEFIGSGGNGVVHRAMRADQQGAIKILQSHFWTGMRYQRFKHEIEGMQRCREIPGVIPLLDFNAPDQPSNSDPPWLVMGLAEPLTKALSKSAKIEQVVKACLEIAEALAAMHAIGLSHRDIKPDNLFKFQDRWVVGDLGLIDFDDKAPVTAEGEKLGPTFYIAPEMLNNADTADGQAADIYSFAKTLWVLATGQRFPLPGEMKKTIPALTISEYVRHSRAPLLDPVIEVATSFDPARRPQMKEIISELKNWLYPSVSPIGANEPDLSIYADEVEGMQARAKALQEEYNERVAYAEREGFRVRELLRPSALGIAELLKRGGFSPIVSIDDVKWGFGIDLHIRPISGIRETHLRLFSGLHIGLDGYAAFICESDISVRNDASQNYTKYELWKDSFTFLLGGSEEQPAIDTMIDELKRHLPRFVERMLGIAKGEEYILRT